MIQTATRVAVAKYDDLAIRAGYAVKLEDQEIVLFKLTTGEVRAIENRSPHPKGNRLAEGLVSGEYVFCPLYDWKISLIDGKVQAPDKGQVKTFEVEIADGNVYLVF
ncbi:MAG: nitrite reductase small subunit NirD [Bacillota bacterium]|nr:nitrite reductase small subunit NirD [Bacillota bacterium]MDP4170853.1 nitrite reductase small subunit NirD [Bacillota bacterium]